MSDRFERLTAGYARLDPFSPASLKEARRQREAADRFQERPDLETALRWRDSGDARYTALPVSTKVSLGYYERDRKAAQEQGR